MEAAFMKTLIFIPGLGYSKSLWKKMLKYFPKNKYKTIAFDIPEYYKIYKGKPLDFDLFPIYVKDVLKKLKIKSPYILVGHSLGGYISLEYSIKFPREVKKLVIVSSPLRKPNSHSPKNFRFLIWIGINLGVVDKIIKLILNSKNKLLKSTLQKLIPLDAGFLKKSNAKSVALCCRDLLTHDWPSKVSMVHIPILLAYGTKDSAVIKINGTELYNNFKNKKVISYLCNHSIPVHHPKELAEEIIKFTSHQT